MKKNLLILICMALVSALWMSNLFAQESPSNLILRSTCEPIVKLSSSDNFTGAQENLSEITPDSMKEPIVNLSSSDNFTGEQTSRAMWDILFDFDAPAGAHVAVANDGTNFYTTTWNTTLPTPGAFQRYDMAGNMIGSTFTIPNVGETRSLTYDGQYFYAGAASTTIRILDLANQTLIGTITAPSAVRHITYDPTLDGGNGGFWIGDWGNIRSITKTGTPISALITFQSGTYPSAYGSAFDNITDPANPCIWLSAQDGTVSQVIQEAKIFKFDINTLSFVPGIQHNCKLDYPNLGAPLGPLGGGAFAYEWNGKWCLAVNLQVTPNKIVIYELAEMPDCNPVTNLAVAYTDDCKAELTWDEPAKNRNRGNIARGTRNYAQAGTGALGYIEFDCENITGATLLSSTTSYGAGYLNGIVYSYRNNATPEGQPTDCFFQIVEAATGTVITTIPRPELYGIVVGSVCYEYSTETMFALTGAANNNRIRTVDLATGELTTVATVTGPAAASLILAMTMDINGNMYAVEAAATGIARFFSIDKATGASTLIGPTGKPANYAQSIAFDYNNPDSPLYWAQLSSTSDLNWMTINVTTGAATLIQPISWEICGLHFPYTPGGQDDEYTYNVYRNNELIATVEEPAYTDEGFDFKVGHTWSVTVVCGDEESLPVAINKPACNECKPATNLVVEFDESCEKAELSWTAPAEGSGKYNIYRGTELIAGNHTGTTYTDTGLDPDVNYTWVVKVICLTEESTPVTKAGICELGIKVNGNTFSIVPNPATSKITIEAGNVFQTIEVISFLGQTVISQPNTSDTAILDVSNLTNGVYFVRIISENGTSVKKFVKQ